MAITNYSLYEPTQGFSETDIALLPVQILITLVGIPGNILVITIVRKNRSMHTTTNFLLVNLAVTDMLTLVWLLPSVVLGSVRNPGGSVGSFLCKFITYNSIPLCTAAASCLTLSLLAVERYNALLKPMRPMLRLTKQTVGYAIGFLWLLCFVIFFPWLFFVDFDKNIYACEFLVSSNIKTVLYAALAMSSITTLAVVIFCYARIIKGMYFSNTICCAAPNAVEDEKAKRKVTKLLIIVSAVYVACFAPYMSSLALYAMTRLNQVVLHKVVVTIMYCNSSINPFILAFQSSNYKEGFKTILSNSCLGRTKLFRVSFQ